MLLENIRVFERGYHEDPNMVVNIRLDELNRTIKRNKEGEIISIETASPQDPVYTTFNFNRYYLVLDGSISIRKRQEPVVTISSNYQSSSFVGYQDLWGPFRNEPLTVIAEDNCKLLSFAISGSASASSVKALTISNTSVDINTEDDSCVIVVGEHEIDGVSKSPYYRIGGPEPNVLGTSVKLAPGTLAIKTSSKCHIVYIKNS